MIAVALALWNRAAAVMFAMAVVSMTVACQMNMKPTGMLRSLGMRLVRMRRCRPAKQEMRAQEQQESESHDSGESSSPLVERQSRLWSSASGTAAALQRLQRHP